MVLAPWSIGETTYTQASEQELNSQRDQPMGKGVKCIKHMLSHNITRYGDLIVEFGLSFDVHGTENLKPTMCICMAVMYISYIGGSNG